MNCERYSTLINDFVENQLDEQVYQEMLSHTLICPNCEAIFEAEFFNEKELCTDFILEVKPLNNLSEQFKKRLKSNEQSESLFATTLIKLRNSFDFLRLQPILTTAIILLTVGFLFLGLRDSNNNQLEPIAKSHETRDIFSKNNIVQTINQDNSAQDSDLIVSSKLPKDSQVTLKKRSKNFDEKPKHLSFEIKQSTVSKIPKNEEQTPIEVNQPNLKSETTSSDITAFVAETKKQLEKTEMLLRSFRNARIIEETNSFDISYEKQQAQKLLAKNIELRKIAENYGNFEIEETLQSTEVFLKDIAELENNSSSESVISLKRKVNNNNIIAILQIY